MKYSRVIICTITMLQLLLTCESTPTTATDSTDYNTSNQSDNPETTNENVIKDSASEKFTVGNRTFLVSPIPEPINFRGTKTWEMKDEKEELFRDPNVFRIGDSLVFRLSDNSEFILEDQPYDEEGDYMNTAYYQFQGAVIGADFWEIYATGYEFHWTTLINKINGNNTSLIGRPALSPNKKLLLSGNADLEAGYTINGFELYEISNNLISEIGSTEIESWGPEEIEWTSDTTFIVKQKRITENYTPYYTWAEIIIR